MSLCRYLKIFKCPTCKCKDSAEAWDKKTLETCNNRSVRRGYLSIYDRRATDRGSARVYVCPSCGSFIKGKNIKLEI